MSDQSRWSGRTCEELLYVENLVCRLWGYCLTKSYMCIFLGLPFLVSVKPESQS